MKSTDVQDMHAEIVELEAKKRLGSKQKLRLAALKYTVAQAPWVTPRKPPSTAPGPFKGDHDGSAWRARVAAHEHNVSAGRTARRQSRFGRYGIRPFRSRIQRQTRKRRTGGVK